MITLKESLLDDEEELLDDNIILDADGMAQVAEDVFVHAFHIKRNKLRLYKVLNQLLEYNTQFLDKEQYNYIVNNCLRVPGSIFDTMAARNSNSALENATHKVIQTLCKIIYDTKEIFAAPGEIYWTSVYKKQDSLYKLLAKLENKGYQKISMNVKGLRQAIEDHSDLPKGSRASLLSSNQVYIDVKGWTNHYADSAFNWMWIPKDYPLKYKKIIKEIIKVI